MYSPFFLRRAARHLSRTRGRRTYPPSRTRGLRGAERVRSGALSLAIVRSCLDKSKGQEGVVVKGLESMQLTDFKGSQQYKSLVYNAIKD